MKQDSRVAITFANAASFLEENESVLWEKAYKRRMTSTPGGYLSYKQAMGGLVFAATTARAPGDKRNLGNLLGDIMARAVLNNAPVFYVARDFMEDCYTTKYTERIQWPEMPLPFENFCLILPDDCIVTKSGPLRCIWVSRLLESDFARLTFAGFIDNKDGLMVNMLNLNSHGSGWTTLDEIWGDMPPVVVRGVGDYYKGFSPDKDHCKVTVEPEEHLDSVVHRAFFTIALLYGAVSAHYEAATTETPKQVRDKKTGKTIEYWSPLWIGKTYKRNIVNQGGTHASPRMHWRRKHLRNQPYGPGRKDRKLIWIDAMPVGVGKDGEEAK